jgi:hypothetical protein
MCEPAQMRGQLKHGFYFDIDVAGAFDHLRQGGFADRVAVAQVLRDPDRAHAELLGALQVHERVLDQDAAPATGHGAQQAAQHQLRRLRTQLAVHAHVLDRDVVGEMALQADVAHTPVEYAVGAFVSRILRPGRRRSRRSRPRS